MIDKYVAGLVLVGSEIKAIRMSKVSLQEAYCIINDKGEMIVKGMHISPYERGGFINHEATRDKILLLNKREIKKLDKELDDQGITIIPTKLFINDKGFAKLEIAVAKGKKLYDKREDIKKRDQSREQISL